MGPYSDILQSNIVIRYLALPLITQASVGFIILLTILFHGRFNQRTAAYAPTILTTTGILFTFVGVALGLSEFDTENVQASVPTLLSGLKTAFWASVAGVGGALTVKFRHFIFGSPDEGARSESQDGEVTAEHMAALLRGIQHALVGDDDASLISQLKLSRQDANDRLDALKRAQLEAIQKLSEMSSKTLVEALRDVIRDFNTKITEQFGDNFKELNDAVGKLLGWQDRYKTFIDEITLRLVEVMKSMKEASASYSDLVNKAAAFSKVSADLSGLLSGLETQKQQLTGALKSLADLLASVSGNLPQIEARVLELTNQLSTAVRQNQEEVSKTLVENTLLMRTSAQDAAEQIRNGIVEQQKELSKALTENAEKMSLSIQSVNKDFSQVNQEFNRQIGELTGKTREQVAVLDAALSEELKKSLESLGRQLAALSEKFVSDYTPLTDKLVRVVSLARN